MKWLKDVRTGGRKEREIESRREVSEESREEHGTQNFQHEKFHSINNCRLSLTISVL